MKKKFLSSFLLCTLFFSEFAIFQDAQAKVVSKIPALNISPISIPVVSSQIVTSSPSEVNWSQKIVLAEDADAYLDTLQTLRKEDKNIKDIVLPKTFLYQDSVLKKMNTTEEVKQTLRSFVNFQDQNVFDSLSAKETLKNLENTFVTTSFSTPTSTPTFLENVEYIDSKKLPKINAPKILTTKTTNQLPQIKNFRPVSNSFRLPVINVQSKAKNLISIPSNTFLEKLKSFKLSLSNWFLPTAYADPFIPIIEYNENTKNNPYDMALYALSLRQNIDGSFGSNNTFRTTFDVFQDLTFWGKTDNTQYSQAFNFLNTSTSSNNFDLALKIQFLSDSNQNYAPELEQLLQSKNSDGGYGFDTYYTSDILTTLQVFQTLSHIEYDEDSSLLEALSYIIKNISDDGVIRLTETGNPSYFAMNEALKILYPFRDFVLQTADIQKSISESINKIFTFLENAYDFETHSFRDQNTAIDLYSTLFSFELYERNFEVQTSLKKYLESYPLNDANFGDVLITLRAMESLAKPDLELISFEALGNWVNGTAGTVRVRVKNRGYKKITDIDGFLFVDNIRLVDILDLQNNGLTLDPNQEISFEINLPQTRGMIGTTNLSLYLETSNDLNQENNWGGVNIQVNPAANNTPALPLYFVAQKMISSGVPAINVRWNKKPDANRTNYIIRFREKGQAAWQTVQMSNNSNGAIIGNLPGDKIYEVVVGVKQQNGTITVFDTGAEVHTSINPDAYKGNVSGSLAGLDKNFSMPLSNFETNTSSLKNGNITLGALGNGSNAVWVNTPGYESYITKFSIRDGENTQNVRVFTRLKLDTTPPNITSLSAQMQNNAIANQGQVRLSVRGNDNIFLKNADFYYYDPQDANWVYIVTEKINVNGGVNFMWFIPAGLRGQGFKIKSVLRDFQGNISPEREFGPFEILDGTAPNFLLSSPQNNENWNLNTASEIRWETESAHPVNQITISLQTGSSTKRIVENIPNTGTYIWNIPLDSFYAGGNQQIIISGRDSVTFRSGESRSDPMTVIDSSPKPDDPWNTPVQFETGISEKVVLAGNQNGNIFAVYKTYPMIEPGNVLGQTAERLVYRKFENNRWGNPVTIYNNPYVQSGDAFVPASIRNLKAKVDSSAVLHILWDSFVPGICTNENNKEIFYLTVNGGNITGPVRVTQNNTVSELEDIELDNASSIHLTWTDGVTIGADCRWGSVRSIFYSKKTQANFSPPERIKEVRVGSYPRLTITNDAAIHLVYFDRTGSRIVHQSKNNNIWSPELAFNIGQYSLDNASLASGQNNILHYVYEHNAPERRKIMYATFENQWSVPEEISDILPAHSARNPLIAFGTGDIPHISYIDEENLPGVPIRRSFLWKTKDLNNGGWFSSQKISLASQKLIENTNSFSVAGSILGAAYFAPFAQANYLYMNTAQYNQVLFPSRVQNLQISSEPGSIRVGWSYTSQVPFDHFELYRSTFSTSSISGMQALRIVSSSADHFTDNTVREQDQYYYALVAVDRNGNKNPRVQFFGPLAPLAPMQNLIVDGDMEMPLASSWAVWGGGLKFQKTVSSSYNGLQSMRLRTVNLHRGFLQTNVPVVARKRYRYSFRYKLLSGILESDLGIRNSNSDFENRRAVINLISNDWQLYSREFTVPRNFRSDFRTTFRVRSGEALIDDVRIEEIR